MSLALARKYRPRNFASVAVQSHVANTLKGAIARDRVHHGYLLCGPRGTGKTTLARVLAMALNCERRGDLELDGEPCGQCISCQRIWAGSASLDVVEIDAASNRGVDDARDVVTGSLSAMRGASPRLPAALRPLIKALRAAIRPAALPRATRAAMRRAGM